MVWNGYSCQCFFPFVVLEPIQVVEQVHQVEFAVVEEQQQW